MDVDTEMDVDKSAHGAGIVYEVVYAIQNVELKDSSRTD